MATMSVARCPKCKVEVGSTWRWCLACGYDPDGSAQRVRQAAIERKQNEGGWLPVLIVLAGLFVGGVILWRTTPDDTTLPTESRSTAAEVTSWVPFDPPGAGFTVDLPALPGDEPAASTTANGRPVQSWAVGAGGHLFQVWTIDAGIDSLGGNRPAVTEQAMRDYVDELARAVSGEVVQAEPVTVGAAPGLDFALENAVVGSVRGRVVQIGPKLAGVSVASRELSGEIAEHAVDSLMVP
jgi:hypothetical protein